MRAQCVAVHSPPRRVRRGAAKTRACVLRGEGAERGRALREDGGRGGEWRGKETMAVAQKVGKERAVERRACERGGLQRGVVAGRLEGVRGKEGDRCEDFGLKGGGDWLGGFRVEACG